MLVICLVRVDDAVDVAFHFVLSLRKFKPLQTTIILILAHDVDAATVLRNTELMRREQFFLDLVSTSLKSLLDGLPSVAVVVSFQIGYVLQ